MRECGGVRTSHLVKLSPPHIENKNLPAHFRLTRELKLSVESQLDKIDSGMTTPIDVEEDHVLHNLQSQLQMALQVKPYSRTKISQTKEMRSEKYFAIQHCGVYFVFKISIYSCFPKEKESAMEMWQASVQEVERLEQDLQVIFLK